jgi:hypothetical protein
MFMLRTSLQEPPPPGQLLLQRRPTGVAQRSEAKSGAKRFEPSSDHKAQHEINPLQEPSL